jgi:hypothetical protein
MSRGVNSLARLSLRRQSGPGLVAYEEAQPKSRQIGERTLHASILVIEWSKSNVVLQRTLFVAGQFLPLLWSP